MGLQDITTPTRQSVPLVAGCAAASLGMMFVHTGALLGGLTPFNSFPVSSSLRTVFVLSLVAPVLALVIWHLFPRRSWAALLMTGALFSVPGTIAGITPGSFGGLPVSVLTVSALVFTLVGVLGAATLIWQAGRPALGAALSGAAVVLQVVGPVVVISIGGFTSLRRFPTTTLLVVTVVLQTLALAAGAAAVIATILRAGEAAARPRPRVTLAAALAAFAPLLTFAIQQDRSETYTDIAEDLRLADLVGNHFLYLGLAFLAAGVVAGAIAGPHALVAAAAAGLTLGAFAVLFTPFIAAVLNEPTLTVAAALGSLVVGVAAGWSRWRAQIGMIGLAVVTVSLVILSFDGDRTYVTGAQFATAALLVLGVIAGAASFSAIGAAHAATSETPAVLTTLPTAFALGVIALTNHTMAHTSDTESVSQGLLLPPAGALLVATLLVAFIASTGRAGAPEGR